MYEDQFGIFCVNYHCLPVCLVFISQSFLICPEQPLNSQQSGAKKQNLCERAPPTRQVSSRCAGFRFRSGL